MTIGSAIGRHAAAAKTFPQKAPAGPHDSCPRPSARNPMIVNAQVPPEIRDSALPREGFGAVAETGSKPTKKRPSPSASATMKTTSRGRIRSRRSHGLRSRT